MVSSFIRSFLLASVWIVVALSSLDGQTGGATKRAPVASSPQTQTSIGAGGHIEPLRQGHEFPHGQTLRYEAEYHYFVAGLATLRIERNGTQEHVSGTADSTGVAALLFHVQDRFNSYFDAKTLCSNKLVKHTEEGSHMRDTTIDFDYGRGKAVLQEHNLKTNESKHTENDIPSCVTDILSGLFYVGSLPLQPGATYAFPLNDGGKTVTVQAHVEAKEEVKTPAGTFQTVRVGPEGDYGALKNRGRVWIWYSDDARHLPVQMRAKLFWGSLTVYLAAIDK